MDTFSNHKPIRMWIWWLLLSLGWLFFLAVFVSAIPIGPVWWDYLALKGLEYQLFDLGARLDSTWAPFLAPIVFFRVANKLSGFGVDYLVAHALVWLFILAVAGASFLSRFHHRWVANLLLALLMLLSLLPLADFFNLTFFAVSFSYVAFYNRYLDVAFCFLACLALPVIRPIKNISLLDAVAVFSLLLLAFFSKLSYFGAFFLMAVGLVLIRPSRSLIASIVAAAVCCLAFLFYDPYYLQVNLEIAAVREKQLMLAGTFLLPIVSLSAAFLIWKGGGLKRRKVELFLLASLVLADAIKLANTGDLGSLTQVFSLIYLLHQLVGERRITILLNENNLSHLPRNTRKTTISGRFVSLIPLLAIHKLIFSALFLAILSPWLLFAAERLPLREIPGFFLPVKLFSPEVFDHHEKLNSRDPQLCQVTWPMLAIGVSPVWMYIWAKDLEGLVVWARTIPDKRVFFVSFPSLALEFLAHTRPLPGARPWLLVGAEINDLIGPDFSAILQESDFVVIDHCDFGNVGRLVSLLEASLETDFVSERRIGCFEILHRRPDVTDKVDQNFSP